MLRHSLRTTVLLAVVVATTHTFVAIGWLRPVVVSGESMAPTFTAGERLLIRRATTPRRWDVVVLRSPHDANRLLVKRVIGLPGERITLREGGVWADGEPRNPPTDLGVSYGAFGNPTWRMGADEWLVVGDNQLSSIDSRNWDHAAGVPGRLLVGVVVGRSPTRDQPTAPGVESLHSGRPGPDPTQTQR